MKLKKYIKPLCIIIVIIAVVFIFNSNVYAEINTDYGSTTAVDSGAINNVVKSSPLLDAIAALVYGVGWLIENVVGVLLQILTGINSYPWADKILFNTVPFLDINFINPNVNSLLGANGLQNIIRSIYFTVLSLSITFFGVGVIVMAVKLVTTAIASDKAKYKEAIMNWLLGLTLLFTIHFGISFIFYLNESLVKVASGMVTNALSDANNRLVQNITQSDAAKKRLDNFVTTNTVSGTTNFWNNIFTQTIFTKIKNLVTDVFNYSTGDVSSATTTINDNQKLAIYLMNDETYQSVLMPHAGDVTQSWNVLAIGASNEKTNYLISMARWIDFIKGMDKDSSEYKGAVALSKMTVNDFNNGGNNNSYVKAYLNASPLSEEVNASLMDKWLSLNPSQGWVEAGDGDNFTSSQIKLARTVIGGISVVNGGSGSGVTIISDLATYFKESAWYADTANGGWQTNKANIQNALMYTILVVQSLFYFLAYVKRLFYVILLSMMAPVMVVYNFFVKSLT